MLDPQIIRDEYERVLSAFEKRNMDSSILTEFVNADSAWRLSLQTLEAYQQERNQKTPKGGKPSPEQLADLSALSQKIKTQQDLVRQLEEVARAAAMMIPNIPLDDVPSGSDESANVEISTWGRVPEMSFEARPHDELVQSLGLVDFERASKISGSRFSVLKGNGAKLERALINFMLDTQSDENGYQEVFPPALVKSSCLEGTGQLPKFGDDVYRIQDEDLWLSPTAEVQLTNLYQNEIIDAAALPVKMSAFTPCFRRESGSYGKDIKGLIRLHQFSKIELVQIVDSESSHAALEALLGHAKSILEKLGLHYRVVRLCGGDLGFSAAMTYDLEVWFPAQKQFREISSCSNFLDFQSRRAMIRYRDTEKNVHYAHTLNGSGVAVGRTFAAIIENYQLEDGTIQVPEALNPYLNMEVIQ